MAAEDGRQERARFVQGKLFARMTIYSRQCLDPFCLREGQQLPPAGKRVVHRLFASAVLSHQRPLRRASVQHSDDGDAECRSQPPPSLPDTTSAVRYTEQLDAGSVRH